MSNTRMRRKWTGRKKRCLVEHILIQLLVSPRREYEEDMKGGRGKGGSGKKKTTATTTTGVNHKDLRNVNDDRTTGGNRRKESMSFALGAPVEAS